MNNKYFVGGVMLLGVVVSGCQSSLTPQEISSDTQTQSTQEVVTGMMSSDSSMTHSGTEEFVYNNYPGVGDIDQSKVGKKRQQGEQRLYINDYNWEGIYYGDRDWIYIGTMGLQSADVFLGYSSGYLYMDTYTSVIRFAVDQKSYSSYHPQLENPNYTGTGDMEVHDKRSLYPVCKDGYTMTLEEVVYDRERYEALIQKNPIRCFAEDKTYIYGRREYRQSDEGGYELMRMKKQ